MLGFIKHLLCKAPQPPQDLPPVPMPKHPAVPPRTLTSTDLRMESRVRSSAQPNGYGKGVEVSLQKILSGLPLELQPRVRQADVGDLTISIPLEKALAQLSRGAIKISFGELRQAAPGVFSGEHDRDRVLVPLPLGDILPQINPALIMRRRVQRQVEVPTEISSPFDDSGQLLAAAPTATEFEEPPARLVHPVASGPSRGTIDATRGVPAAIPPSPAGARHLNSVPVPLPPGLTPGAPLRLTPTPLSPPAPAAPPAMPNPLIAGGGPSHPAAGGVSHRIPAAKLSRSEDVLLVPLSALAEAWPEAVRREILALNLVDAKVALPVDAVEQALKQGRIHFSWKTIRLWLRPALPPSFSAQDTTVLELPLKVVTPVFLARQRAALKAKPQITVDDEIPNLFFGFPQPDAASSPIAAPPRSSETNYYVWDESQDTARVHESEVRRGPTPGTKFAAKYATPNEVVSRAAGLDGVVGALIALPDGLMVANRLPPDLNAETLAAFLPQIFGKVSQCTKELRMGELNNLNFTVGNVPWKIFRVHAIFFAAFGRAGVPLPTAQLAALAAELDHKPK
jgi:predicted regulator of Ras-like GTPase activity (Roadblock/LC7/MglB family)